MSEEKPGTPPPLPTEHGRDRENLAENDNVVRLDVDMETPADEAADQHGTKRKSPESRWFFSVKLAERARDFADKLYQKVLSNERLSGGTIERKALDWAQRAEIWHHASLEKAANSQIARFEKKFETERKKTSKHEGAIAELDENLQRLREIAARGNFPVNAETTETFEKKRNSANEEAARARTSMDSAESIIKSIHERRDSYANARRETVDRLLQDNQETRSTNITEILHRVDYLEQLSGAAKEHEAALKAAQETLEMAKQEMRNFTPGGDRETKKQIRRQLQEFVATAEKRCEAAQKLYDEALGSKKEMGAKISALLSENEKRQQDAERVESKYLTPQERQERTNARQQVVEAHVTQGEWDEAANVLLNQGDLPGVGKLVSRALAEKNTDWALFVAKALPPELREDIVEYAINNQHIPAETLSPFLELLDDEARHIYEQKVRRQTQDRARGRTTANQQERGTRPADVRERPPLNKRALYELFVDEYDLAHPDEPLRDLPMLGNPGKKYQRSSDVIPDIQEAYKLKTGKTINKKEAGEILTRAMKERT